MGGNKDLYLSESLKIARAIEKKYVGRYDRVKPDEWKKLISHLGKNLKQVDYLATGGEAWTLKGSEEGYEHRPIVIKIYRPSYLEDPLAPERIRRTAIIQDRLCMDMRKSKIPRVIASAHDGWSACYTMMDYVPGKTLLNALWPLPMEDRIKKFLEVCEAVVEFHNETIVHRDLKPDNIIITNEGKVAFFDWGSSFEMADNTRLTNTGFSLASVKYGSPEQLAGYAQHCDFRSDVCSLANILCALVTEKEADCLYSNSDNQYHVRTYYEYELPPNLLAVYQQAANIDKSERHRNVNLFLEGVRLAAIQDDLIQDPKLLSKTARIEEIKRRSGRVKQYRPPSPPDINYEDKIFDFLTEGIKLYKERRGQ